MSPRMMFFLPKQGHNGATVKITATLLTCACDSKY